MNQKLPKPMQEALARGGNGDAHPSLDVLMAFAEHVLTGNEKSSVGDHLAQCADCRELVFLANSAVDEGLGIEAELVAAAAGQKPVSDRTYGHAAAAAPLSMSPRRSAIPMGWALAAVAGVAIITAGVVWRFGAFNFGRQATTAVVSNEQAATPEQMPAGAAPHGGKKGRQTKAEQAKTASPEKKTTLASNAAPASPPLSETASPSTTAEAQSGARPLTSDALAKPNVAFPAASTRNGFAPSEADRSTGEGMAGAVVMKEISPRGLGAARGRWRISSDGHVEHEMAPGSWTRVPVDQATRFRVVSIVGNDLWAGGSGGALFHSRDGGIRWNRVTLSGETSTVVSIRFADTQHGTTTTSDGSTWKTADGGNSWTKQ